MTIYSIFNSSLVQSAFAAALLADKYPIGSLHTMKDINGLNNAAIDAVIAALTNGTYDKIFILAPCEEDGGDNGEITTDQAYALIAKLKAANQGTQVGDDIENASTHTANTIGKAAIGWTVNEHAGRWVVINGGTGANQVAKIISNTTTVITIEGAFATTPDATSDFQIFDTDLGLVTLGNTEASTGKKPVFRTWESLYPNLTIPVAAHYVGGYKHALVAATAVSVANGTLTDTGEFAGVDYTGCYVYIKSATAGANQYRKIASNTDDVLTLESNWTTNPTGTIIYRIMPDKTELFVEEYLEKYITTYMLDPTKASVLAEYQKLFNHGGNLAGYVSGKPPQDLDYLKTYVLLLGKAIYDSTYTPLGG